MHAKNFFIALYDEERQLINWPYHVDEIDTISPTRTSGIRSAGERARNDGVRASHRRATAHLVRAVRRACRSRASSSSSARTSEDWLGVPLRAEGATVGVLVVQSYTKDVRYTEQDKDLLAFVGQHVGAALSRARAIEETRQRNAELALINSVQEALAGELELQAIYDVVGDKIQEIFDAQGVDIAMLDEATGLVSFPYSIERGERLRRRADPLRGGFTKHVLETREPLLINEDLGAEARAVRERPGGRRDAEVRPLRPAGHRRTRDRRHLARQLRPRARVRRGGPAAADDARGQPERRARERAARARDAAAERRAGADQQRPGGARGRARAAGDLRRRRRQDPGGLRRAGRRHRDLRRGVRAHCASRTSIERGERLRGRSRSS